MRTVYYKDFNQFSPNKSGFASNENAIYQSVVNIISIIKGEIPFQPEFPLDLESYLFELDSDVPSGQVFVNDVASAIESYDRRITVDRAASEADMQPDYNRISIVLIFNVKGFDGQTFRVEEEINL